MFIAFNLPLLLLIADRLIFEHYITHQQILLNSLINSCLEIDFGPQVLFLQL